MFPRPGGIWRRCLVRPSMMFIRESRGLGRRRLVHPKDVVMILAAVSRKAARSHSYQVHDHQSFPSPLTRIDATTLCTSRLSSKIRGGCICNRILNSIRFPPFGDSSIPFFGWSQQIYNTTQRSFPLSHFLYRSVGVLLRPLIACHILL